MRRTIIPSAFSHGVGRTALLTSVLVLLLGITAVAQNPHFVSGPTANLSNNDNTLTECSTIAGLGSTPTDVSLTCTVTFDCMNKGGGVDEANQTVTTTVNFVPHNGTIKNACVSVTGSCPKGQAGPVESTFSNCTYSVSQGGSVVLRFP
jgi:hypothetical protein